MNQSMVGNWLLYHYFSREAPPPKKKKKKNWWPVALSGTKLNSNLNSKFQKLM
jgi:hypothetical protein